MDMQIIASSRLRISPVSNFIFRVLSSSNKTYEIPTIPGGTYNYGVLTSDGQSFTGQTGNLNINFDEPITEYIIQITGVFPSLYINNSSTHRDKILEVITFGIYGLNSTTQIGAFFGANNLIITATDGSNFGTVKDFSSTWYNCTGLTSFPLIDTSGGNNFSNTWRGCQALTSFPALDFTGTKSLSLTWVNCTGLTSFSLISTAGVQNFQYAWYNCNSLPSFPLIDMSSATTLTLTWYNCTELMSFPQVDLSNCVSLSNTWRNCTRLTSFPLLDTSSCSSFSLTWSNCNSLPSFPLIDISSCISMNSTWQDCSGLKSFPLIDFKNVTTLNNTWRGCSELNTFPLINTAKVRNFLHTWRGCSKLTSFPSISLAEATGTGLSDTWRDCTSLSDFPSEIFEGIGVNRFDRTFMNTDLSKSSIDKILLAIDSNENSNGIFFQSGGSAPSITGTKAIDRLRGRDWDITVTGGY